MATIDPHVFVDRDREVAELRRVADRARPGLVLIYGRRRVGKTYLLRHAFRDRRLFYFLAADLPPARNRLELLTELSAWSGRSFDPADYPTWRTVFRLLVDLAREAPLVVVLDEFQYLLRDADDDAASQLVAIWDREAQGHPLTLVLCGSEVATLRALQGGDQPLYGRVHWSARIHPFDYYDTAKMAPHLHPRDAAVLYGVFGGTPRYLAAIEPDEPIAHAVVRTFLSTRGEVHIQLDTLIEQEKGIRETAEYRAVLTAVASGATQLNEIAQRSGTSIQRQSVRKILDILEDLDLVERERNFAAPEKAPYRYRIADNAVTFWYRFVQPFRSRLEAGDPEEVWEHLISPHLNGYMGKVFERIVRQAYARRHRSWGMPGVRTWARWEGKDRDRRDIEIDVVASTDSGQILTGEVKWTSTPAGVDLHRDLQRDLEDLARSGHDWAKAALNSAESAGFLYVSAAGFTEAFQRLANERPNVRLLTLDDLYST